MGKKRGKFIVVEGGEGSGKSGALARLKKVLGDEGFYYTREPGGTLFAEGLRSMLLDNRDEVIQPETELMLFCAGRRQHIAFLDSILAKGEHVICDRFSLSSLAYQIYGRERLDLLPFFKILNDCAVGENRPDLTILLDVDYKTGLARRSAAGDGNRFEEEEEQFHCRVNEAFRKHVAQYTHVYSVIDANKAEEEVQEEFVGVVKYLLNPT